MPFGNRKLCPSTHQCIPSTKLRVESEGRFGVQPIVAWLWYPANGSKAVVKPARTDQGPTSAGLVKKSPTLMNRAPKDWTSAMTRPKVRSTKKKKRHQGAHLRWLRGSWLRRCDALRVRRLGGGLSEEHRTQDSELVWAR